MPWSMLTQIKRKIKYNEMKYSKNMANFEAFYQVISSSIYFLLLKNWVEDYEKNPKLHTLCSIDEIKVYLIWRCIFCTVMLQNVEAGGVMFENNILSALKKVDTTTDCCNIRQSMGQAPREFTFVSKLTYLGIYKFILNLKIITKTKSMN